MTSRALNSKDVFDVPTLMIVPNELVLSAEAVEEWGKVDAHFKEVLEKVGGKVCYVVFFEVVYFGWELSNSGANASSESAVYEERCYALSVDADYDCCEASWDEYWPVKSMDGVCKNDAY